MQMETNIPTDFLMQRDLATWDSPVARAYKQALSHKKEESTDKIKLVQEINSDGDSFQAQQLKLNLDD